jgi:hypothetical protein
MYKVTVKAKGLSNEYLRLVYENDETEYKGIDKMEDPFGDAKGTWSSLMQELGATDEDIQKGYDDIDEFWMAEWQKGKKSVLVAIQSIDE